MPKVTVFSLPDSVCVKCRATKLALNKAEVPYEVVRLDKDPETLAYVKSLVGDKTQAPVVVVDYGDGVTLTWTDFRLDKIKQLAKTLKETAA